MSSSFIPREVRAGVPAWGEGGEMEGGRVREQERERGAGGGVIEMERGGGRGGEWDREKEGERLSV